MDLEFYPMTHGDPRSGDWVLLQDDCGCEVRAKWGAKHQGFVGKDGYLYDVEDGLFVGWLPIAYWRPSETLPAGKCLVDSSGRWMPYPIHPPKQSAAPVNQLAAVSDADLIAELQRRMGCAK